MVMTENNKAETVYLKLIDDYSVKSLDKIFIQHISTSKQMVKDKQRG